MKDDSCKGLWGQGKSHSHNTFLVFLTVKYLAKKNIFFSDYDKRWNKLYKKATIKCFLTKINK